MRLDDKTSTPPYHVMTPDAQAPQGNLKFKEYVGVRDKSGSLLGQVRLMTDAAKHLWVEGKNGPAGRYDVTGKTRAEISEGVASGAYGRLTMFPKPVEYKTKEYLGVRDRSGSLVGQVGVLADEERQHALAVGRNGAAGSYGVTGKTNTQIVTGIESGAYGRLKLFSRPAESEPKDFIGVRDESGKLVGQVGLLTDSSKRSWIVGRNGESGRYEVTGKSRSQIADGIANGHYGRLKLLPKPAEAGTSASETGTSASEAQKRKLVAYLDRVVSSNSDVKSLGDLRAHHPPVDADGHVDPKLQKLWKLVQNEAFRASSGKYGIDPVTGKAGSRGTVLKLTDEPVPTEAKSVKAAFNPSAAVVYSLTGAVAAYNNLRAAGMDSKAALLQLPAGFARDVINIGLSQLDEVQVGSLKIPLDSKNPYLKVAIKGGVGAVLTAGTNALAGALHPPAKPPGPLNVGMIIAAATVNGSIIGLGELQKRGYLGGVPPDNPKDWKEWVHKYLPQSAAIGVGVEAAILPAVIYSNAQKVRMPPPQAPKTWSELSKVAKYLEEGHPTMNWAGLGKTAALLLINPTLQGLAANLIVNPPAGAKKDPLMDKVRAAASPAVEVGSLVGIDKLWSMLTAGANWSAGASVAGAAYSVVLGQIGDVMTKSGSVIGADIKQPDQAREALKNINDLLAHPAVYLSNPNPALMADEAVQSRDDGIKALKAMREEIYRLHPEMRPH